MTFFKLVRHLSIAMVIVALLLLAASIVLFLEAEKRGGVLPQSLVGQSYKEIAAPHGFVNTSGKPITIAEFVGEKVILLEFMTYTCVNCQRSYPHLVSWNEKFTSQGLQIIGIHTPEYAYEREIGNVEGAMAKSHVTFPVVLDNEYATWNAYGNKYWPRTLLVDMSGTIVYDHIGGGGYEATEEAIVEILKKSDLKLEI